MEAFPNRRWSAGSANPNPNGNTINGVINPRPSRSSHNVYAHPTGQPGITSTASFHNPNRSLTESLLHLLRSSLRARVVFITLACTLLYFSARSTSRFSGYDYTDFITQDDPDAVGYFDSRRASYDDTSKGADGAPVAGPPEKARQVAPPGVVPDSVPKDNSTASAAASPDNSELDTSSSFSTSTVPKVDPKSITRNPSRFNPKFDQFAVALKSGVDVVHQRSLIQLVSFLQPVRNLILIGDGVVEVGDLEMIDVISGLYDDAGKKDVKAAAQAHANAVNAAEVANAAEAANAEAANAAAAEADANAETNPEADAGDIKPRRLAKRARIPIQQPEEPEAEEEIPELDEDPAFPEQEPPAEEAPEPPVEEAPKPRRIVKQVQQPRPPPPAPAQKVHVQKPHNPQPVQMQVQKQVQKPQPAPQQGQQVYVQQPKRQHQQPKVQQQQAKPQPQAQQQQPQPQQPKQKPQHQHRLPKKPEPPAAPHAEPLLAAANPKAPTRPRVPSPQPLAMPKKPLSVDAVNPDESSTGWKSDGHKNLPGFRELYTRFPDAAWYIMLDDDTYVFFDNLADRLSIYDPDIPHYFGAKTQFVGCDNVWAWGQGPYFAHGGSGIVVSRGAMREMMSGLDNCIEKYRTCWAGDVRTALCLRDQGVLLHSPSGFYGSPPNKQFWFPHNACDRPLTFHHLLVKQVQDLYNLEKKVIGQYGKGAVTFGDIYWDWHPTSVRLADYDRKGAEIASWLADSVEVCEALCKGKKNCVTWVYDGHKCWMKDRIPPGKTEKGILTGVVKERYMCNASRQGF